jgi:dTDP-4-dehydrorhamnose 3,5-epimerase
MIISKTKIEGLLILEPELKIDQRGYFARTFCKNELRDAGANFDIAQASLSFNKQKGTVRGMHFQKDPKAEDKIVQCLRGAIYDVAIDLRKGSPTYGKWVFEELNEENKKAFLIPKGFAHGFQSLTDNSEIQYFMSEFYSPEHSSGARWDDPFFNIDWPIKDSVILSDNDKNWPLIESK